MAAGNETTLEEWKGIKKAFETATNKKKPSKKFLGIRVGSNIEAALKKVDAAWGDRAKLKAAYTAFKTAKQNYAKTLSDAGKVDDQDYKTELGRLTLDLENIEVRISDRLQALGD